MGWSPWLSFTVHDESGARARRDRRRDGLSTRRRIVMNHDVEGRGVRDPHRGGRPMPDHAVSARIKHASGAMSPFLDFLQDSAWSRRDVQDPRTCDFVFGNPHEMPLPGVVTALQEHLPPRDANWFAYKVSEPESRETVAASLRERLGAPFLAQD